MMQSNKFLHAAVLTAGIALITMGYSNCTGFTATQGAFDGKSTYAFQKSPLLALSAQDDSFIPPDIDNGASFIAPVTTTCSDYGSATLNGNVVRSTASLDIVLVNTATQETCTYRDPNLRDHLVGEHKLVIPNLRTMCPGFGVGTYQLKLIGNANSSNLLAGDPDPIAIRMGGAHVFEVTVTKDQFNSYIMAPAASMNGIKPSILLGANQTGTDITVGSDRNGTDEFCDLRASPLLIQIHAGSSFVNPIEFTRQTAGVLFDILGQTTSPAHTKRYISWFTPQTVANNFFVVLPDANGNVTGIDQMFGDNTTGPDGLTAKNGYEALRKWDGRRADGTYDPSSRDGVIDAKDPIFSKLRLWLDSNADGVAQAYELSTLGQSELVSIDLNYDASYGEMDKYGNQIKLKSVARDSHGNAQIMYDIWFKYY